MKNKSGIRILQYGILAFCAVVFVVCAVILVKTLVGYSKANSLYHEMTLNTEETQEKLGEADEEALQSVLALMESYQELKTQCPNIVGYVNIPSVSISYPVVQWTDNEYYTTHLITGEKNKSGSIFLDYHVETSPSLAKNLILYGHNMNDKSMFHNIRDLFDEEIFRGTQVQYICDEGVFLYDSLAIYVTDTSDIYYAYAFYDDDVFFRFFEERAALSRFPVEYEKASNIITLVTCSNSATNPDQRFLYHGKLVRAYTDLGEDS